MTVIYSLLPLLLAWCAFSPPLALVGSSVTLLWAILPLPETDGMIWVFILFPLLTAILWQARPMRLRQHNWGSIIPGVEMQHPETK